MDACSTGLRTRRNPTILQMDPEPFAMKQFDIESIRRELTGQIEGEVRFDNLSRSLYSTDASVYQIIPTGVVIPKSRTDVIRTVQIAQRFGCSITARGGGTSQAGQAVGSGIQLDFSKYLNRIVTFNPDERWVRVEPGIVLDELNAYLKPYGLQLPLDISTSDRATIGGMIANNSSGTRSVVYGKTLDYVLELTAILANGEAVDMRSLSGSELDAKCKQDGLEGDCYRAVSRLSLAHAAEIDRRFPKILRRVGGYNLDEFVGVGGNKAFNLSRLMVGSEGTLALVVEAKLKLVPLPPARALLVAHFDDLLDALAATPVILNHRPSAVELVDRFILDATRGKPVFEPLRSFITGDPAAILVVELFEESAGQLPLRLDRMESDLRSRRFGYHVHRAIESAEQARIWKLRRAALGLSMSERGDAKAISFVEDTAVAPEQLRDYIERFQQILNSHGTHAGFYAHASVGLLHVRPVINLKTGDGVDKFQNIAREVSDLVLEFGGALSGEHGDGLARSSFQEKMYGPELYSAFCEIKQAFDSKGVFNPGKIVHAPSLTKHLRYGAEYVTPDVPSAFDFSDYGGLVRAAEQCSGVGECRKTLAGTMCPSYMATRDESDSTRGRANALRLAMTHGQTLGLNEPELRRVLDLCLECKACKSECPTGVDMARLKAEFLNRFHERNGATLRTRLLADPGRLGRWGCRLVPVSNWITRGRIARWFGEKALGISRHRTAPVFAGRTFERWYRSYAATSEQVGRTGGGASAARPRDTVQLFVDSFMNYFEPSVGEAAIRVFEAAGVRVQALGYHCCGRPLISQGLLDAATQQVRANVERLWPIVRDGATIAFCEPSCLSAMRDDGPGLLRGELQRRAQDVAQACRSFEEILEERWSAGQVPIELRSGHDRVLLHAHCHQKALGLVAPAVAMLSRIPQCKVIEPDAGCCGMAGSFGYLSEHFAVSQRIGELRLMPAIRELPAGTPILAAGTSCRQQITQFTGKRAVHPAEYLWARIS